MRLIDLEQLDLAALHSVDTAAQFSTPRRIDTHLIGPGIALIVETGENSVNHRRALMRVECEQCSLDLHGVRCHAASLAPETRGHQELLHS